MNRLAIALMLVALSAQPACSEDEAMSEPPSIEQVKDKHANELLARPGVVSVGIGLAPDGKPAIVVGLEAPQANSAETLPETLEGYPVITQMIGPVEAQ
jgi:hypothetical protein